MPPLGLASQWFPKRAGTPDLHCLQTAPHLCCLPAGWGPHSFSPQLGLHFLSQADIPSVDSYSRNMTSEHLCPRHDSLVSLPASAGHTFFLMKPGPVFLSVHVPRAQAQPPFVRLKLPGQSLSRRDQLGGRGFSPTRLGLSEAGMKMTFSPPVTTDATQT